MLRGYIGNTDFDWYEYLAGQGDLDEVNFWQPSGGRRFGAVPMGAPFFFKLKSPHNAIAGFGCFARHEVLPAWLAWDCFGKGNGVRELPALLASIGRLRHNSDGAARATDTIGCIMITEPVFFPREAWIPQPRDWAPNIVQGKTYDLSQGEGRRLWEACCERAEISNAETRPALVAANARYGAPQLVPPRLGQGTFRVFVTDAYEGACAVTTEHSLPALEAAHIRPYSDGGEHAVSNGILLRSDIHRLFDRGYVTVTPDHRFEVSRRLKEEWENGRLYYDHRGDRVFMPARPEDRPDPGLLTWHNENVFQS